MLTSKNAVTKIPKVGPKYLELLKNLEIHTVGDLIYHFPFRYDDFSVIKPISETLEGETVTIKGTLTKISNIYTKFGKKLTKGKVGDNTGYLDLIWFNQQYISSVLKEGEMYNFSGKVEKFANKLCLISPDFELESGNKLNTGRLVPVYPETAGVSSKWLRTRINDVVSGIVETNILEFLPKEIINKYNFLELSEALKQIHFPENINSVISAKKRLAFEELFLELLRVEKRKLEWNQSSEAPKLKYDTSIGAKVDKFIKSLPFELTKSQAEAKTEIFEDMQSKTPMNRLLEGDVGTGKTVVAALASYLAFLNGYKVLYMAPTELLAQQHYQTFKLFLEPFGVDIVLKTGSTKTQLDQSKYDIAIGTHALLFGQEKITDIGLVIIDEQHRFGVSQRAKILEMTAHNQKPHLLTMTATPIPRTLALTLFGDLSISTLSSPPNSNKKITTKVVPEGARSKAYEWIRDKNEQAFIVCPLIEASESESLENVKAAEVEFKQLQETYFKGINVGLLHGRMKSKEKEEIVNKFKSGEIKILVSTPVIEVGIDIPEATVIVIESAERYGLASLHQLRGRVGRGNKEGFCFVFMSNSSKTSYERLKNLEIIQNGLELAETDMKYRGYGDIYGTMQHGFKTFKLADIQDTDLLEKCKVEAQSYFPKLNQYPTLAEKVEEKSKTELVEKN